MLCRTGNNIQFGIDPQSSFQVEREGRILLAEGGTNCRRGLRVDMFGMELSKRGGQIFNLLRVNFS